MQPGEIEGADLIIIPGSKSTHTDRLYLKQEGWDRPLGEYARQGGLLFGICGGLQILGQEIADPHGVESELRRLPGLGLLPVTTTMAKKKTTQQVEGTWTYRDDGFFSGMKGIMRGYEIHMGTTKLQGERSSSGESSDPPRRR